MEIENKFLKINKTVRYSTFGDLTSETKYFWILLHGSNMICEQMLYKFKNFNPNEHFLISPEGLSRFYKSGFNGDVVASWITKRDRLEEIKDVSAYLTKILNLYKKHLSKKCKTILLGFSQGGTIGFRWLHSKNIKIDYFIPYSCWIPEDINLKLSKTDLNKVNIIYTYGIDDPYINKKKFDEVIALVNKNKIKISFEKYKGSHRVEKTQLIYIFKKYIKA